MQSKRLFRHGFLGFSLLPLVVGCIFLLAGCDRKPQGPPPARVQEVSYVTVAPQEVLLSMELSGRTSAFRIAEIRPRVNGLIQRRLFTEGADVKEGQVLYQIDPAPFEADLSNAQAALAEAQAKLPTVQAKAERYNKLLNHSALAQQDYDDAASALNQLRANIISLQAKVETARINLGYTKVIAPISGRIGKSSVTDGAIVTAYQATALATIQQLNPIYVDVPQSTAELLRMKERLKKGLLDTQTAGKDKVRLVMENGKPYPLEGTLQFSDVSVDPTTGSVIVRLIFPNPEGEILPGMFVKAIINEGMDKDAMLVTQQAVTRDAKGNPFVLVVNAESKAEKRDLTLDRAIGNQWLVTSGLNPGDKVIVEGLQMLRPGAAVKASPMKQSESEQPQTAQSDAGSAKRDGGK